MMLAFPWGTVLRQTGEPAIYTPAVGDAASLYAKRIGGARTERVGEVTFTVDDTTAHVLRADLPSPAAGDTITIAGETFTIGAVEPLADDPLEARWSLRLTWGVSITLRTPGAGGGGSDLDPVPNTITLTARAADAGASAVTLVASDWTAGAVRAGDVLTVGGTDYTADADVQLALVDMAWTFPSVPITPALAASVSVGAAVTVVPPAAATTRTCFAAPAEWTAEEIAGGIATSDMRFVIRNTGIAAPTTSDLVLIGAETTARAVTSVRTIYSGGAVAAWVVTVQA